MIRKAAGTAALVVFGVLCALLIAEAGVRVANRWFPYFYCYDAARGWGLRPHTAGYYRREGGAWVSINADGFRGPDFPRPKPPGTIRVAVLGDSYTQAIQVPYEDTFASVAARTLAQCPPLRGRRVEALNFGVDGYGTAQELVTLREKVWPYHPDIVVLAVFLGNDVRNNSVPLEGDQCRPFFVVHDGKLEPAGPFDGSASFRLWCMTRFDYRKAGLLAMLGNAWTIIREHDRGPTAQYPVEAAINYNIYKPPADKAWTDAWQVTEALIAEMHREVAAHGAAFLVATLDTSIQVWPEAQVRQNFMKRIGVSDLLYPDRRIAGLGEREGFDVLTLAEPLRRYAEQHHAYLHVFANTREGFGHWNKEGHRVAGELIGERLCAMVKTGKCASCTAAATAAASDAVALRAARQPGERPSPGAGRIAGLSRRGPRTGRSAPSCRAARRRRSNPTRTARRES